MVWWLWVVISLVLLGAEIFTPGFGIAWFGISALTAGMVSELGLGLPAQLIAFGGVGLLLTVLTRRLTRRMQRPSVATNADALVGRPAVVTEAVGRPGNPFGYVRLDGQLWRATAAAELEAGVEVVVLRVEGVSVVVAPTRAQ